MNVYLSIQTVAGQSFDNDTPRRIFNTNDIADDWEGMDAAPATLEAWKKVILASKTILWNGPVGVFDEGYPPDRRGPRRGHCQWCLHPRGRR